MDETVLAALGDPARLRLVRLLVDRPRPVGVLARLADARQPQTTKHLQTLERAGVVACQRSGARRIYRLEPGPLRELAFALNRIADDADREGGPHETYVRYDVSLDVERSAAETDGWADGRSFSFVRTLSTPPGAVWRYLTEEDLLPLWWTPDELRVSELVFEARPGGRIVHEYRDIDDDGSDLPAGRAEGVVEELCPSERLAYRTSPELPDGTRAFTAHITFDLQQTATGTRLDAHWQLTDSTVDAADFIAGIEIGFGQSLDRLTAILTADE